MGTEHSLRAAGRARARLSWLLKEKAGGVKKGGQEHPRRSSVCKSEKISQEAVSRAQGRGEGMGRDGTGAAARPVFSTKRGRVQFPSSETIRRELMQSRGPPSV